jgi:pyruvate dehydrogenase E1 component beta subunit
MPQQTYRDALRGALAEEMRRDDRVFILGEEVGVWGGVYAVTRGLYDQFGPSRIVDTPIAETSIVGLAIGAALGGLRPVAEIMTINFSLIAMDQIVNHAAKMRYMFGGQLKVPIVIRMPTGWGQLAATHSQALEPWFASVPGLIVVAPATPSDAKGLLKTAIRSDDPVIFIEHARLYATTGEVPETDFTVPFGVSEIRRAGADFTIISYSRMLHESLAAAAILSDHGIEAEVIDLRTLRPLDMAPVYESVKRTHHAIVVEEAWATCGMGAEISARIHHDVGNYLDAPVERLAQVEAPMPYARNLEALMFATKAIIAETVQRILGVQHAIERNHAGVGV